MKRRLLLVSNSTLHGGGYLEHCQQQISDFFGKQVKRILFVPYALHNRDSYTKTARDKLKTLGYEVDSVHEAADPVEAVRNAEGIFIGGGNTFRLLKALYDHNLVTEIRTRVLQDGVPYMGSSAGSNVATFSINTTNDMPIVYPPTFSAIGLVPFNINPHYLDPDPNSRHMGLHELPDHHYETLKFLSAHLKTVAENSEKNKMEPRNLAIVFGPTLVRTSDDNMTHMVTHMPDQYKIVETLIQHYDWFFTEEGDEEPVTTVQQDSAVETQPVPNIDHLLTNIGRTGTSPGEVSDSPTSDSAKSKGSWGSGKDQCSRELVSSIFAAANRKRRKHKEKLQPSSSDDDLDAVFPKKELAVPGQEEAEGDTSPVPAGETHHGKEDAMTTPKSRKEHRNSFFMRDKLSASPKHSVSPKPGWVKSSLSDPPSQMDEATSDLGTMSSGASVPRSRPRKWGTATLSAMELSPAGPTGASATAEVSSITSDYSTTSSNTFLTGAESSALSPEVQSMTESRAGDEADDEQSELVSEGRPMETDSESDFPVFTSGGAITPALDSTHKTEPSAGKEKADSRRLLPSHRLIECDSLSRKRSVRQKTDSESSVEGAGAGTGAGSRSEPNRLSRVLEAMKKGRSTGSLSSSSSRSESDRNEPSRRLRITERLKSRLRLSADDMFGIGERKSRTADDSKKKSIRRRHTMGGQRDFGELAVINDWREQGGGDQGAELPAVDQLKPQEVSIRDWIARERWKSGGSRASKETDRLAVSEVKAGAGEEPNHSVSNPLHLVSTPSHPVSTPSPQSSTEQVNGGGPQAKGKNSLNLGSDAHPHKLSGAQVVRSRFYQCL